MPTATQTHTPGPWRWIADVEAGRVELWPDNGVAPIAVVETTDWIGADESPDLRLIAAAPDLLSALKAVLASATDCDDESDNFRDQYGVVDPNTLQRAMGAIARAEGR